MKKNIVLTFDYELFLGSRSGTAAKCMLEPTESLSGILKAHNAKAVFFVDTLSLINYGLHEDLKADLKKIKQQLVSLYNQGHYIFPHIHPHWLDANYISGGAQFDLSDLSKYSLSSVKKEQVHTLFAQSITFLTDLGISYPEWGYRAGGWCIQPFELFRQAFIENNIKYEFSVLPGYKNESKTQAFDYSGVKETAPYFFSDRPEVPSDQGEFTEYPISCLSLSPFVILKDRIIRKYLWKTGDRGWGDGTGAITAALKSHKINSEMVSIELLTLPKLRLYKKYIHEHDFMHWISHPKMFTKHGLKVFDRFLKFATSDFSVEFDFKNMISKKDV